MTSIGIIGGLGIGKAHALAAIRNGYHVQFICDNQDTSTVYKQPEWINSWATFTEKVTAPDILPDLITPYDLVDYLKNTSIDLVVIATPDRLHSVYLELLNLINFQGKILCEKPLSPRVGIEWLPNIINNTFISHEWACSQAVLMEVESNISQLAHFHNYPPSNGQTVLDDLGSHIIYTYLLGYKVRGEVANPKDFNFIMIENKPDLAIFNIDKTRFCCGYNLFKQGIPTVFGYSTVCDPMDLEVIVNNEGLGWATNSDLLDLQMKNIINNNVKYLATLSDGYAIDNIIQKLKSI